MRPTSRRRVAWLERTLPLLALPKQLDRDRRIADGFDQMIVFSALVKFGDPKPDEPLSQALQRCFEPAFSAQDLERHASVHPRWPREALEVLACQALRKKAPQDLERIGDRKWLQGVIDSTPLWLLAFARIDQTAELLD